MKTFRFHLLGFPHTATNRDYCHCAYTSKIFKFICMMAPRGHTLIHYGNEGSEMPEPIEHVQILTEAERASWFGAHDRQKLYDLKWDANEPYWRLFNERAIEALKTRVQPGDFILSLAGYCQKPIADAFPGSASGVSKDVFFIEYGIGYYGTFSRYRCYESSSHREWLAGALGVKGLDTDGVVIPNYFDLRDFQVDPATERRLAGWIERPYYLFLGRGVEDKGIWTAIDTIAGLPDDVRLIVAGQGGITSKSERVVYFGAANIEERAVLLKHAIAVLMPTLFREPFGGVAVESMLCGTPVITMDHGAFVENVPYEWRCRSHREFVETAEQVRGLSDSNRILLRHRARKRWSLEAVAPQYERYFGHLWDRWGDGWYEVRDRTEFGP